MWVRVYTWSVLYVYVCPSLQMSYGLEPAMVILGVKMVYVPMMPGHRKRLPQM